MDTGPRHAEGTVEIGWGVSAEYRKQGLATEGTRAVIEWAMAHASVRRVIATIPAENRASQRVAEQLGMSTTQEVRRGLPVWEMRKYETIF